MCNLSIPSNDSTSTFEENYKWFMYCICHGYFGTQMLTITVVLFALVGTVTQFGSLWMFINGNIKANLVFPLNITLVDLLFCLLSFVDLVAASHFSIVSFQLCLFFTCLCWTVSPLLQMCMCVHHYLAVIHPVMFLRYKGIQYKIAQALAVWILGLSNGLRIIFIQQTFFPDHIFFLIFGIAAITISFCCASVLRALQRSSPGDKKRVMAGDKSNKPEGGRAVGNQQKRKAFRIISHTLISILACYLPQVVTYVLATAEITKQTYLCNVFPFNLSLTVVISLTVYLIKMYKEHNLKNKMCFKALRRN